MTVNQLRVLLTIHHGGMDIRLDKEDQLILEEDGYIVYDNPSKSFKTTNDAKIIIEGVLQGIP